MPHTLTQTEWEQEMSVKILHFIHSELYLDLRFLDLAFSALLPKTDTRLQTFATDGIFLYYSPPQVLRIFQDNHKFLSRAFLHSVLHCVFSHLWLAGNRNQALWNTACDIAVEYTIDCMDKPSTRRILSWARQRVYSQLISEGQGISAAVIYRMLKALPPTEQANLQIEFYTDDHCYWPAHGKQEAIHQQAAASWNKIARQSQMQQRMGKNDAQSGETSIFTQIAAARSRRSYREFLKKFTVLREELHCDTDEYDLNLYTYGLRLYGNLPLIEPVETREIRKIREFVIVIDTSGSTSGQLVKNFLSETFRILHQTEQFFTKCKIRLLQCDDQVRMDQEIEDFSQAKKLLQKFTILGGGGTNFCPAFAYVDQLVAQGTFENLGGLLYFTDGFGIYPKKCPPYQAAFLFLNDYDETAVPPWAMRLRLEPEEFLQKW